MGDSTRVSAQLSTFEERPGLPGQHLDAANDAALLSMQFENGAQGGIHVSSVAHLGDRGPEQQVLLHGEAGTIEVNFNFVDGYTVRGTQDAGEPFTSLAVPRSFVGTVDPNSSMNEQIMAPYLQDSIGTRLFIDAIAEDRPRTPSFYDGFKVQQVIGAALASIRMDV